MAEHPNEIQYDRLVATWAGRDMLANDVVQQLATVFSQAEVSPERALEEKLGVPMHVGHHAVLWRVFDSALVLKVTSPTAGNDPERNEKVPDLAGQMLFMKWLGEKLTTIARYDKDISVQVPDYHFTLTTPAGELQAQTYMHGYEPLNRYAAELLNPKEVRRLRYETQGHLNFVLDYLSAEELPIAQEGLAGLRLWKGQQLDMHHILIPENTVLRDAADIPYCIIDQPRAGTGRMATICAESYYERFGENSPVLDIKK